VAMLDPAARIAWKPRAISRPRQKEGNGVVHHRVRSPCLMLPAREWTISLAYASGYDATGSGYLPISDPNPKGKRGHDPLFRWTLADAQSLRVVKGPSSPLRWPPFPGIYHPFPKNP